MDRTLHQRAISITFAVQEHPFTKGWTLPGPKLLGLRPPPSSPKIIRTRMATISDPEHTDVGPQDQLYYNQHAKELTEIPIGNRVAIQNPATKMWDIYGTVVALGHHRRYFVKTQSGRVLVRNRRFLRKRILASVFGGTSDPPPTPSPSLQARYKLVAPHDRSRPPPTFTLTLYGCQAPPSVHSLRSLQGRCKDTDSWTIELCMTSTSALV